MKTAIKVVGIVLGVLVLIIIAAVVILPMYIDPNDYKDQIAAQVEKRTGRDVNIEGDIELSVFPWLGFDLGRVTIGSPSGFEDPMFARSERLQVRVKLMPLLQREVQMDEIVVQGLALHLARNAQGKTNWGDLMVERAAEPEQAPAEPGAPAEAPPVTALAVGGVDIRDATLTWDDAVTGQQYAVRNFQLQTGALAPGQPVDVDMGFTFEGQQPQVSGEFSASAQVTADLEARVYRVSGLDSTLQVGGEALPGQEPVEMRLQADAQADLSQQTAALEGLRLALADLEMTGELQARQVIGNPAYQGSLSVAEFNPRALLERFGGTPFETADPNALKRASAEATLKGTAQSMTLEGLTVRLDDTTLTGDVSVENPSAPALGFQLTVDAIDLDRYMPPGQTQAASPGTAAGGAGGELPLEAMRALDADGKLSVGRLGMSGLTITAVEIGLKAQGGQIRLNPLNAELYEGTYQGDIRLDARGEKAKVRLDERLAGVQAGPLLADLAGQERLTGTGNVRATLEATGRNPDEFKRTLNGDAAFEFLEGAVRGINIGRMLRQAKARLEGRSLPESQETAKTDFTELTGTIQIKDGVARNEDLLGKSPLLRVQGQGSADLAEEQIDYRLRATLVATAEGQGGRDLQELAGLPVPIRVSGPLADPNIGLDMEALAKAVARKQVEERGGEVTEKLEKQLEQKAGEGTGEAVKGILKGLGQ